MDNGIGIGADVEVRAAGRRIAAGADLSFLDKGELDDSLDRFFGKLARAFSGEEKTMQENNATGVANAAGTVTIDCGAPALGKSWDIKRLIVGNAVSDVAPVTCIVRVYRVEPSNPLRLCDFGIQLPSSAFYSRSEFNLKPDEHLWIVITGAPAATGVVVAYSAEETTWNAAERYSL